MSADRPCGGVRGALPGLAVCVMPKYTRPQPNMARSVEELSDVEQLPALLAKQIEELSDVEGFFALLVKQGQGEGRWRRSGPPPHATRRI